jgi:hypothetical protein
MHSETNVHPDEVLEAILTLTVHPIKKRNLALIHQICCDRSKVANNDFSLKSIGELIESQGGLRQSRFGMFNRLITVSSLRLGRPMSGQKSLICERLDGRLTIYVYRKTFLTQLLALS